jgi:serine/threonine protein kinase
MAKLLARLLQAFQKKKTALPANREELGIGSVINRRFRLDAEIGHGGMGIVYRARDIPNDREVALKLIDQSPKNALSLQQFRREAEIMAGLHHPHIVAVHETGIVETSAKEPTPFIVMELVRGFPLNDARSLTYARIIDIAKQICDALEYVHEQGFIYRDLKPGNVYLEKSGFRYSVRLLDFGLARPRHEAALPMESNRAGTVFYLAPELIAGGPADVASDLYALGATMYEMITGRVPFSDIDEQNILAQHVKEIVVPPSSSRSDVPPVLESIVLRLLEKDARDRFASAREVSAALDQVTIREVGVTRSNLPQMPPSAREDEIAAVIQLLETSQLVTLLNHDATLANAVGAQLIDQFADGAWLIQLESVADPSAVLPTVAQVLRVRENPNRPPVRSLIEFLREKNLLLIMSPCDHLRVACAQLVGTILRECPEVYVLAISHQPLNIPLEKCYSD